MIEVPNVNTAVPSDSCRTEASALKPKPTGQIIWDAMQQLREDGQAISRQRIMEVTGLNYTRIDDHVSRWIESGRLRRVVDGVYELPEPVPEPRPVSFTDLPDGMTLIEVGDQELRVWPREMQVIGRRSSGDMQRYAQLQTQHDMGALLAEATVRNRALADRVSDLERAEKLRKQAGPE